MIGLVLAAGAGRRLGSLTADLPKALLEVTEGRSILEITLGNLRAAGLTDAVVVTGYASQRIEERLPDLQSSSGLRIETVFNDKAEEWNNAYSLWCAREVMSEGALLVNGDTLHPPQVEQRLLDQRGTGIALALDREKSLGEEEMKVVLDEQGRLQRITKLMDPATASGEYIGLSLIEADAVGPLTEALEATWRRDPGLYYEDGYQELVNRGGEFRGVPIGTVDWVEVDNAEDFARARAIAGSWA